MTPFRKAAASSVVKRRSASRSCVSCSRARSRGGRRSSMNAMLPWMTGTVMRWQSSRVRTRVSEKAAASFRSSVRAGRPETFRVFRRSADRRNAAAECTASSPGGRLPSGSAGIKFAPGTGIAPVTSRPGSPDPSHGHQPDPEVVKTVQESEEGGLIRQRSSDRGTAVGTMDDLQDLKLSQSASVQMTIDDDLISRGYFRHGTRPAPPPSPRRTGWASARHGRFRNGS